MSINRLSGISFCNLESPPSATRTFGDSADSFQAAVLQAGSRLSPHPRHIWSVSRRFHQVRNERKAHKVNSTYLTCYWRCQGPSPLQLANFLALPDNTSDLARFLSEHITVSSPPDKVVVAVGGFVDEREVQSSERAIDLSVLTKGDPRGRTYTSDSSLGQQQPSKHSFIVRGYRCLAASCQTCPPHPLP